MVDIESHGQSAPMEKKLPLTGKTVTMENRLAWLKKEILPKITKALGRDYDHLEYKISTPSNSIYASGIHFVDMDFHDCKISLVVKTPPISKKIRDAIKSDQLFHNEILFYSSFPKNSNLFPKCIFKVEEPLENAVIVTENITKAGYQLCRSKYDIPLKYVISAVQEIGRFHGKGYVLKEKQPTEFYKIVNSIQESRFEKTNGDFDDDPLAYLLNHAVLRPVIHLRSQGYDSLFCDKLEAAFSKAFDNLVLDLVKPKDTLAVLCHGDFTRNNVLFREVDEEVRAKLIDFAMMRYGSPALDVSTFVYLSCDGQQRKGHFPAIFKAYHDALYACLVEEGVTNLGNYSLDAFEADYKKHALFGCVIALFFLPRMYYEELTNLEENLKCGIKFVTDRVMDIGGKDMSEKMVDMVLELKDTGCLDHIL